MKKKVSIIIPVYNSEKEILELLNSIEQQTNRDFEVIIINDGSTDDSEKVIKSFIGNREYYNYFKIHNSGVSKARNFGLNKAKGDIICFIDSDDWIEKDYIKNVINDIEGFDFVVYGYYVINDKQLIPQKLGRDLICENKKSFYEQLSDKFLFNSVVNKIFLREKLSDIKFKHSLNLAEDLNFVLDYFTKVDKIKYIDKMFYNYRVSTDGLGFSRKKDSLFKRAPVYDKVLEYYIKNKYDLNYIYRLYLKAIIVELIALIENREFCLKKIVEIREYIKNKKVFDISHLNIKNKVLYYLTMNSPLLLLRVFIQIAMMYDNYNKRKKFGIKR